MADKLFRCFELRDKFLLFEDLNLLSSEFPDWLSMRIIEGEDHYTFEQSTNCQDSTGKNIYENDIIYYQEGLYCVVCDPPGYAFKLIRGDLNEDIIPEESEIIGNAVQNPELMGDILDK